MTLRKEFLGRSHCYSGYPLTIYSNLIVVFYNRLFIWSIQQAEADICFMIVKEIDVANTKFIPWSMHQFLQLIFLEWYTVNIQIDRQLNLRGTQVVIIRFRLQVNLNASSKILGFWLFTNITSLYIDMLIY